jgi:uncharacterized membrane-anchored protein
MSMGLGYLLSSIILTAIFAVTLITQFNPVLYWAAIIATPTLGTTLADYADKSIGIGYAGGTTLHFYSHY